MHPSTLGIPGRELDDVTLAQGVVRICHEVTGDFREGLAQVRVPDTVVVGDADGAVHFADRRHGAGSDGVGVVAEGGEGGLGFCCWGCFSCWR